MLLIINNFVLILKATTVNVQDKKTVDDGNIWTSPVSLEFSRSHQKSDDFKNRLNEMNKVGSGINSQSSSTAQVLNILRNVDIKKKNQILEPLKAVIVKYASVDLNENISDKRVPNILSDPIINVIKSVCEITDKNSSTDDLNSININFKLGEPIVTFYDDIISEFQYILNALLFSVVFKYDISRPTNTQSDKFTSIFKKLIIDGIHQVHQLNKSTYIHYEEMLNHDRVVLQEMFSLLGIIRFGVPDDSFLVTTDIFNPFEFNKNIIGNLEESQLDNLREQLCHLFNSNNQSNRRGITLMVSESFLKTATEEFINGTFSLSSEEYSRFCQAEIFILNTEEGIIILDMTNIEQLHVHVFVWISCVDVTEKEAIKYVISNNVNKDKLYPLEPTYKKFMKMLRYIFERDTNRLHALDRSRLSSGNRHIYPINIIIDQNDPYLRSKKIFIFTVMFTVFFQGNAWPVRIINENITGYDSDHFRNYAYLKYDADSDYLGITGVGIDYSRYLKSFCNDYVDIMENMINDFYFEDEFFSFNAVSTLIMAILGQYTCYNKSILAISGMGFDYTLTTPRLSFVSFNTDFLLGKVCSSGVDDEQKDDDDIEEQDEDGNQSTNNSQKDGQSNLLDQINYESPVKKRKTEMVICLILYP